MNIIPKQELIKQLIDIKNSGWIKNARPGNVGGIGNTVEDILGIEENNLPIPNAGEWELKCQRANSNSLTTLKHSEPSPRAIRFVPSLLLPNYGWKHKQAGKKYPTNEMSFRQTIHGSSRSDRGFKVIIDNNERKLLISFDSKSVDSRHDEWLKSVDQKVGLNELSTQPYWGFDDLFHIMGTKLINCFYLQAEVKKVNGIEYYSYTKILMLEKFIIENFVKALESSNVLIDFDARTGHNHGTKFRLRQKHLPELYSKVTEIK